MSKELLEQGPRLVREAGDISVASLRRLYENWCQLASEALPDANSVDPVDYLDSSRGWVWIDVINNGEDFRARFVGPDMVQLIGSEPTGLLLSELSPLIGETGRSRINEIADMVLEARSPVVGGPRRTSLPDKNWVIQRSLSMPFSSAGDEIDRILMAVDITW